MRKIIAIIVITCSFQLVKAQDVRTFNHLEFSLAPAKDAKRYSIFWGQSFIKDGIVPFRFATGLKYSYNTRNAGIYQGKGGSKIPSLTLGKSIGFSTFSLPVGLELIYKNAGIGFSQDLISYGNKSFKLDSAQTAQGNKLTSPGFSTILGKKKNLNNEAYLVYTTGELLSFKAGITNLTSTFIKTTNSRELGYTILTDQSYYLAIRINLEK